MATRLLGMRSTSTALKGIYLNTVNFEWEKPNNCQMHLNLKIVERVSNLILQAKFNSQQSTNNQ